MSFKLFFVSYKHSFLFLLFMFFLLSKFLAFLASPFSWTLILFTLGFLYKKEKTKKFFLKFSFVTLLVFGNSFLIDEVLRYWEIDAVQLSDSEKYDYGIVLSGMTIWDSEYKRVNFNENADRILQSIALQQNNNIDSLIISGGDGSALQNEVKEAVALKRYLNSIEYNTDKLILECNSKNTYENAINTSELLTKRGVDLSHKKILLITSALHMKRSLACFEKQGITCTPYVTNRTAGPRKFLLDHLIIPSVHSFRLWDGFFHELIGFVTYYILGYI